MLLSELASRLGAQLVPADAADAVVTGVAAVSLAGPAHLVFAESAAAFEAASASQAGAVLVTPAFATAPSTRPLLLVDHPKLAFARAARLLDVRKPSRGIHDHASVSVTTIIGKSVSIRAGAVIEKHVTLGDGVRIDAGVVVGEGVRIGAGCHIYPRVVIYPGAELGERVIVHSGAVLGSDGFGYVRDPATGEYIPFPQQGRLIVEDDVEIGANTTIDRGALETTRIGRGTKIDNLVHIGHNVQIGRNVVIAAQTGISGSSSIGDGTVVGGQVGIGDHVEIGPAAILGSGSGVLTGKRLRGPGMVFWGTPARPLREYLRELATLSRLARRSRDPGQ